MDVNDSASGAVNQAKTVNANALTIARNAIAKAMQSSKTAHAGEVAFA